MSKSPYSGAALKRAGWQFLSGKALSAALTFVLLLAIVRLLPVQEYGAYVTFAAALELAYALAGFGLPWLAARYLPEFRLHADGALLARLAAVVLVLQFALLGLTALALFAALDAYLGFAGLGTYRSAAALFLLVFVVEYGARFVRESLLGPLMQQGLVRASLVSRQLVFLLLLVVLALNHRVGLAQVVLVELLASMLGLAWAAIGLYRHLKTVGSQPRNPQWSPPNAWQMWGTAKNMYLARLLTLAASPQAMVLMVQKVLSAEAVALFGFLRSLYQQASNNLPATMLFSLLQPKLVASRVSGGVEDLSRNANLAGKLSLFVLMPAVALTALLGSPLVALTSSGKFDQSGYLLFGFMLALIPFSQRLLLETVAVAAGQSALCTVAALSGLLVLPLLWWLVALGWGLWAPVAALAVGYWLFNAIVQFALMRRTAYRPDRLGAVKLFGAAAIAYALAWPLGHIGLPSSVAVWLAACVLVAGYLGVAWLLKPFTVDERARLNTLFRRPVFIW